MSSLCSASYRIIALHDEDLDRLYSKDAEQLLERCIDISLGCNFIVNGPGRSNCRLKILTWKNGSTDLCGSCSFCNLLADSIQRSVESDLGVSWNLSSNLDPAIRSRPCNYRVTIRFDKLKYQIYCGTEILHTFEAESKSNYWDLYLLLLTGHVLLYPGSDELPQRMDIDLAFELFGEEDDPVVKLIEIHRHPLHGPRLSDENVAKIRDWITDCDENHAGCRAYLKHLDDEERLDAPMPIPTRLVDVGDALKEQPPRLVLTSRILQDGTKYQATKYIALSYCWGPIDENSKLLQTTQATIGLRTEKIELNLMPQTFQDAIVIARRIGIRYLWIDSLCIIQDDAQDWQTESSRMAEIFSNAYLTLAVACGSGCNDGFLNLGLPSLSCAISLSLNRGIALEGQLSLRFRRRGSPSDKMSDIIASRYITRGWTFQEERLARRVLMFGENKFFFDCRTLERSQDTNKYMLRPNWVKLVVPGLEQESGNVEGTGLGTQWEQWQTLCAHYSYRELTYPEDKLPAISGMANKVAKKVQSRYLAGLWSDNLLHDLFWRTVAVTTKPNEYRAPSWSWASLDGRITWPLWQDFILCGKCKAYCAILDAQTTLAGLDPYGSVKDGFLKVRGILRQMEVKSIGGDKSQHPWKLCYRGQEIGNADLDSGENDVQVHWGEKTFETLLVAECRSSQTTRGLIRGLLLEKNGRTRESHDEFERVGIFTLFSGILPARQENLDIWRSIEEQVVIIV